MSRSMVPLLVLLTVLLTACSSADRRGAAPLSAALTPSAADSASTADVTPTFTTTSPAASRPVPTTAKPPSGTVITTSSSQFGEILFDSRGQAIYLFEAERSPKPECYADCATAWPPVRTVGVPRASGGVDQKLLGTTSRTDGTTQATYRGHPLYFYAGEGPREVTCHKVSEFGGLWLVLDPTGTPRS